MRSLQRGPQPARGPSLAYVGPSARLENKREQRTKSSQTFPEPPSGRLSTNFGRSPAGDALTPAGAPGRLPRGCDPRRDRDGTASPPRRPGGLWGVGLVPGKGAAATAAPALGGRRAVTGVSPPGFPRAPAGGGARRREVRAPPGGGIAGASPAAHGRRSAPGTAAAATGRRPAEHAAGGGAVPRGLTAALPEEGRRQPLRLSPPRAEAMPQGAPPPGRHPRQPLSPP
ncbi:basic salivary proline-rich protein 1-like [Oxyura jamaicensis]|uniref:basic salivary proline-rich protein 1-like n=1 Tax=Oxyura jamaicensis TaxID=8884 RepID=UPI0015A6CD32|nr:basic salivary proline-rich protein 1-like [Oxyura jamaicensis]